MYLARARSHLAVDFDNNKIQHAQCDEFLVDVPGKVQPFQQVVVRVLLR